MGDTLTTLKDQYEGWAIVEVMGQRKVAGLVSRVSAGFGVRLLRVELPLPDALGGGWLGAPEFGIGAVYCVTPVSERLARDAFASYAQDQWALPDGVRELLKAYMLRLTRPEEEENPRG